MADEEIDTLLEQGLTSKERRKSTRSRSTSPIRHRSSSRSPRTSSKRRHRRDRSSSRSTSRSRSRRHSRRDRRRHRSSRSRSRSSRRDRPSRRRRSRSSSRDQVYKTKQQREEEAVNNALLTPEERAEQIKQRELMELTRDHRTVFIGQLVQKVKEADLDAYFSQFGKLQSVLLIRDKFTNRSKGFAYVECLHLEDVPKILLLNGQVPSFQSFPIMIKASEAEKNFAARKDSVMNATSSNKLVISGSAASRIYCGNLHTNITEEDLKLFFTSFGEVVSVTINRDDLGRSKGFGFIQFMTPSEANLAMSKGNGLELAGNHLRLGPVNDGFGGSSSGVISSFNNTGDGGLSGWKLDDEDGTGGLLMTSQSRSALMAKLAGADAGFLTHGGASGGPAPLTSTLPTTTPQTIERMTALASVEIEGTRSFCFVIKNMFDLEIEQKSSNSNWATEIQLDVEQECATYGTVLHTYVETQKTGGLVYVLMKNVVEAVQATTKLHGRWFNQRQISIRYLSSQEYVGMFPETRSAVAMARATSSTSS